MNRPAGRLPCDCVVPAAGFSRRMGEWKPLLPWKGRPLVVRCVESALASCERVVLVAGFRAGDLTTLFSGIERVSVVLNPCCASGMFSSIKRGILDVRTEECFLLPGDMPAVSEGTWRLLHDAFVRGAGTGRPFSLKPVYEGRGGHPLLMNSMFREHLLRFPDESSMKDVFAEAGDPEEVVVDDPGILFDLDTPEDYEASFSGSGFKPS